MAVMSVYKILKQGLDGEFRNLDLVVTLVNCRFALLIDYIRLPQPLALPLSYIQIMVLLDGADPPTQTYKVRIIAV